MQKESRYSTLQKSRTVKFNVKLRALYALILCIIILLGLGSRHFSAELPHFVSMHFGDALWAGMVYFGLRFLVLDTPPAYIALLCLAFSFVIETSQLYQANWINEIRQTLPGALILGHGFLWVDLLRYTAGVVVAWSVDKIIYSLK